MLIGPAAPTPNLLDLIAAGAATDNGRSRRHVSEEFRAAIQELLHRYGQTGAALLIRERATADGWSPLVPLAILDAHVPTGPPPELVALVSPPPHNASARVGTRARGSRSRRRSTSSPGVDPDDPEPPSGRRQVPERASA